MKNFGIRGPCNSNFGDINVRKIANQLFPHAENVCREMFTKDVDIIIDLSGLAYADVPWGMGASTSALEQKRKSKARWIFMPQTFGPFNNNKQLIKNVQEITKNSLVFAREYQSQKYLNEIDVHSIVMPDIMWHLELPIKEKRWNSCCPSSKVNEKLIYPNFKVIVGEKNDKQFFQEAEDDFYKVAEIISYSKLVISGRYHVLIYALLNHCVVACSSWSHKYDELFERMGLKGNITTDLNKIEHVVPLEFIQNQKEQVKQMIGMIDGFAKDN